MLGRVCAGTSQSRKVDGHLHNVSGALPSQYFFYGFSSVWIEMVMNCSGSCTFVTVTILDPDGLVGSSTKEAHCCVLGHAGTGLTHGRKECNIHEFFTVHTPSRHIFSHPFNMMIQGSKPCRRPLLDCFVGTVDNTIAYRVLSKA